PGADVDDQVHGLARGIRRRGRRGGFGHRVGLAIGERNSGLGRAWALCHHRPMRPSGVPRWRPDPARRTATEPSRPPCVWILPMSWKDAANSALHRVTGYTFTRETTEQRRDAIATASQQAVDRATSELTAEHQRELHRIERRDERRKANRSKRQAER